MTETPATIVITAGGLTVFRLDEDGGMIAPQCTADRLAVLSALTQAATLLAAQPLEDDPAEVAIRRAETLGRIGTPAAIEALDDLRRAADAQADAINAATDIISATLPSTH